MDPVGVQTPATHRAPHQPRQQVPTHLAVKSGSGGAYLLRSQEVRLADQRRVGRRRRHHRPPRRCRSARCPTRFVLPIPHRATGVPRVRQDHRDRPQPPRSTRTVRIPFWIRLRRRRHTLLGELPGDAGQAAAAQPLREHPPHLRRRLRIRIQALQPSTPPCVRPVRVWPGVDQPVPVRRPTAQVPALLPGLRPHRGQHPMPRPEHLPLRLRTQHRNQRSMHRTRRARPGRPPRAATPQPRSCPTTPTLARTGPRRTPARTHRPRPRRSAGPATTAHSAGQQPPAAMTTAAAANSPHRRTPPRPCRGRRSRSRRPPAATPATTPGPDARLSRCARRRRTSNLTGGLARVRSLRASAGSASPTPRVDPLQPPAACRSSEQTPTDAGRSARARRWRRIVVFGPGKPRLRYPGTPLRSEDARTAVSTWWESCTLTVCLPGAERSTGRRTEPGGP